MSAERQSAPAVRCGISCVGDADAETARMEELRRSRPRPSRTQTSRRRKRAMAGACWTSTRSFEVCRPRSAAGVHAVHGSEICDGRKSAEFPTGGVRWRRRALRIGVWDETSVVRALRKAGMESLLRSRTYVFCGDILRDRDTALDLRGVEVGRVGEEFVVRLFGARL